MEALNNEDNYFYIGGMRAAIVKKGYLDMNVKKTTCFTCGQTSALIIIGKVDFNEGLICIYCCSENVVLIEPKD